LAFITRLEAEPEDSSAGRLLPIVLVTAGTGLRLGEVLGLRWRDVDLQGGFLRVVQQAQQIDGDVTYTQRKTRSGEDRPVPLTGWVPDTLESWRRRQIADRLRFGPGWIDSGLVFTDPAGRGLQPWSVSKAFHRLVTTTRPPFQPLPETRFHDLRHLAATLLQQSGVPLPMVSRILGHSSTAVTDQAYNHVTVDQGVRAAMDNALNKFARPKSG
jgi:integrase